MILKLTDIRHNCSLSQPLFIVCDKCYWCATYFDKTRIPIDNICPYCKTYNIELTSLPIMLNDSLTIDYNEKS